MKYFLFLIFFIALFSESYAQLNSVENLDEVSKKGFIKKYISGFVNGFADFGDPFTLSGQLGLQMRSYDAFGGPLRQDPFFYTLNANLNVRVYQVDIPFSMVVTAKNQESSLPSWKEISESFKDKVSSLNRRFARFGLSPHYKWAKLHIGHRSMSFSKYTLDNLNFKGIGAELTPGKVRLAVMAGQLAKAEPIDLSLVTPNIPVYQRTGWGAKVGYGDEQSSIDLSIFKAKDDATSIFIPANLVNQPAAEENLALGIQAQKLFFKKVRAKIEYASSTLSPNALDAETGKSSLTSVLLKNRTTTENSSAIDASLAFEGKSFIAGVQFKRIDPNYRTLGAYFFNRDVQEFLGNLAFNLLDNKLNLVLNGGLQSNNLDNSKPATTQRIVYAINAVYTSGGFTANATYNNNTTDVGYVLSQNLDSLNVVIVTKDLGVQFNYTPENQGDTKHSFSLSANLQDVNDDIVNRDQSAASKVLVANVGYHLMLPSEWKIQSRINYNQNEISGIEITRYGAGFGVAKALLKNKLNLGFDTNYFINSSDVAAKSNNLLGQLMMAYAIGKGVNAQLNWGYLRTKTEANDAFAESTITGGIQYSFQYKPAKKSKTEKN